ncbi:Zn-ribbon domain-containing OB-fold protein [Actinomadura algeriensis]|uniref:OB-fold protein n=1 Tax=Actinomadura algeriensis TaxID=1679523 RepID=A0ABR9K283_9ACTN|nr:OB-fold domain-containing protein [Actinomadura algeriensis]MBE1536959.1 putative OB-fold protein [Actinomadura algeriensis]
MDLTPVLRDEHSAPFFDGAAEGVLVLRYSPNSGEWSAPAASVCAVSQARDLEWRAAAGTGELVSWTVKPGRPGGDGEPAPDQVIGIVELAEGPWLTLRLVDVDPAGLRTGQPVRVGFVRPDGGEAMPVGRVTA